MTTANKITVLRILLIPFFVTEMIYYVRTGEELHRLLAIVSFAAAAISDGIDGYIARRYNQKSELGAILDPLADKLLLVSSIIILSLDNNGRLPQIPFWATAAILSRDILVTIGVGLVHYIVGDVKVRPRMLGKVGTVLQMGMVVWGVLKWDATWFGRWCAAAAVVTVVSGLLYIWDGMNQLGKSPKSSATTEQ
jgi:cardiolipin synthase (CMP-forming)